MPWQVDNFVLMSVVGGVLGSAVQRYIADRALSCVFVRISDITHTFLLYPTVHKKRVKHQQKVRNFRVCLDVLC